MFGEGEPAVFGGTGGVVLGNTCTASIDRGVFVFRAEAGLVEDSFYFFWRGFGGDFDCGEGMFFGAVDAEAEGCAVWAAEDAVIVCGRLLGEAVVFTHERHVVGRGFID